METYELLVGSPAPDEAALVGEFIRNESELWDIADGKLVPIDPGCEQVATEAPEAGEIVTSTEPPQSAEQIFDGFTSDQIAAVGGPGCALELAEIFSAAERFAFEVGSDPDDLQHLVTDGYLDELPTLWELVDELLTPVADSGCLSLD